jgi:hypothetical protein
MPQDHCKEHALLGPGNRELALVGLDQRWIASRAYKAGERVVETLLGKKKSSAK